jgi:hypothetical protein
MDDSCPVHGEPLVRGTVRSFDHRQFHSVSFDDACIVVEMANFPTARMTSLEPHIDSEGDFCQSCRDAQNVWSRDGISWSAKAALMELGYDPFRGHDYPRVEATLVSDYVVMEKWIRAMAKLRLLVFIVPSAAGRPLDDVIREEVERARSEGAPLNATRKAHGGWMTDDVEEIEAALLMMGSIQSLRRAPRT